MMTLRENAMAIYNRQQPDYYFDLMDAIQLVPDPVLMAGMFPQDGKEYKDPWGTAYIYKPGAPGPHPHVTVENRSSRTLNTGRTLWSFPQREGWTGVRQKKSPTKLTVRKNLSVCCSAAACLNARII